MKLKIWIYFCFLASILCASATLIQWICIYRKVRKRSILVSLEELKQDDKRKEEEHCA